MDVGLTTATGASTPAYRDALDYLFVRTTGAWRFGLERTAALLDALGNPHRGLRVVHVGGTNGKGSVCATIERVLRDRGFRVGAYTSPHLIDFRERIVINGRPIDEREIVQFVDAWTPTIERIGATFFEATTAMAFGALARANVDVAVVEVGLGGRLDATNVVDPLAAIVTSVAIDHTEYLGETRAAIAFEKAGIFKRDRAAIIGERDRAVSAALAASARAAHAAPIELVHENMRVREVRVARDGTRFTCDTDGGAPAEFCTALLGAHQASNAAIALRALELLPVPLRTSTGDAAASLRGVRLAGRFDQRGKLIFDVAHNRDGARVFASTLASVAPPRPRACVLSVLRDKDWRGMMEELAPEVDEFVLTLAPSSPAHRAWNPADAADEARRRGWRAIVESDFDAALQRADKLGQTVLVAGSFHTVGDAMLRLHVSPHGG